MPSAEDILQYGLIGVVAGSLLKRVIGAAHARRMIPGVIQQGAIVIDVSAQSAESIDRSVRVVLRDSSAWVKRLERTSASSQR